MSERLCWVAEAVSTGHCTAVGFFSTREEGLAAARKSLSSFQSGIVEHLQEGDPDTSEEELRKMLGDSTWEPWEEVVSEGEDVTFFISRDFMRGFNYMIVRPVTEDEMVDEARTSGPQNLDHRTGEDMALALLKEHLGARPLER